MKLISITAVWCPACLIMRSRIEEIKTLFPQIEYIEYDYDMDEEVNNYNVTDILPVFIIKKDDIEIKRLIGEKTLEELVSFVKGCIE